MCVCEHVRARFFARAVMSDVRDALPALCEYINLLINVGLTSEHLRLAKGNVSNEDATETLWRTLRILSCYAAREKRDDADFRDYDASSAVKLHLAFLQYPMIEFYGLSQDGEHNRDALIALAWLLGTQNVLTVILRAKLADGVLGTECSCVDPPKFLSLSTASNDRLSSTSTEFSNILHLNSTVNLNLREINELIRERAKLISKVHAASLDVNGLPHLSVSELALTKRFARIYVFDDEEGESSEKDQQRLREFREFGILLNMRAKWLRKRHIFFDWMVTVIQEHRRSMESNPKVICTRELIAFNSLLRHVIRGKLRIYTSEETVGGSNSKNLNFNCTSRAYRNQCNNAEAKSWLDDLDERQNCEEENFRRNKKQLTDELKGILKLIPSVVRV